MSDIRIGVRDFWRLHFLILEPLLSLTITGLFAFYIMRGSGDSIIARFHNRASVYGAMATIFGSLLGFVITAFSILVTLNESVRLTIVRGSKHYPTLWRVFTNAMNLLTLATIACLSALSIDDEQCPNRISVCLAFGACAIALAGTGRCFWVFE